MSDRLYVTDPMRHHWARFRWALRHPFTRTPEPVGGDQNPKHRLGIVDLPHALTNLFVEAARALPYRSGHRYMYLALLCVALTALVLYLLIVR